MTKSRTASVPMRRLVALSRPELKPILAGTAFLAIGSAAGLLYPQAVRLIIDEVLGRGSAAFIDGAALIMLAIFLVQGVSIGLRHYLFTVAGERIVARLREDVYRSVIRQEIAFFDQRRTGELLNRLSSDTTVLQNTVSTNVSMGLRNIAASVGGLAFLLYTSAQLTVLMVVVVPPVAVGAVVYGRRIRRYSRQVQDALARASEVAEESIAGIRTVRSFAAEEAEAVRYGQAVMQSFELAKKRTAVGSTFVAVASFSSYAAAALVLWYGGHLVLSNEMTVGELTAFLVYTLIVAFSLGSLSGLWTDFMRASGAAERVFEILDRKPAMAPEGGTKLDTVAGDVRFEGVRFHYPSRPDVTVLDAIDLSLSPGKAVALVGPSGAGKSTVAALLGRLYDPDAGQITLDGHDLKGLDPEWLREQIGVVSQEPVLFATTITDNIRYSRPDASEEDVRAAARVANAHSFIEEFPDGYNTMVGERGIQLSGGQKQRVAIARAVLKDPRILILDEATSALDAESEHLVQEALERLMAGRTTLIIAHRLSTVMEADQVAVLSSGAVAQIGEHAALMTQGGIYKRLVERQFVVQD